MNIVTLKYGTVRDVAFEDDFYKGNELMCDYLAVIRDFMRDNGWNFTETNYVARSLLNSDERRNVVKKLCKLLERLLTLGVTVYNDWTGETHETFDSIECYLHRYLESGGAA